MEATPVRQKPALALSRHYPVAPEKVWRAWTDPEAIKKWWGPGPGEPVSLAELDVRVGGRFRIVFGGPDGKAHECAGVYKEVVPSRKLVFTWTWPNSTPERESLVTIIFKAVEGGTELAFRHEQLFDEKVRDDHERGWSGALGKLEGYLSFTIAPQGEHEIVITRAFDAPRPRVWEALTKPGHLKQWLGVFGGWSLAVCEVDLRVGGRYRFVWRNADGGEMGMSGVYREIVAPERFVVTERFDELWYPGEALVTQVLGEENGRTTLTATMRYESRAARDGVLASPMERGILASYDKLAELSAAEIE
jgi:uncharacterized protein YndB with AHSA1/START domain